MQYRAAFTVPAGTLAADPATLPVSVAYGRLKSYEITFPAGVAGTVYVQAWYLGRQILPTSPGASYRGDELTIRQNDNYPLFDPPYELELRGWSPDATYDHTIALLFYVEAPLLLLRQADGVEVVEVPEFEGVS